MFTTVFAFLSAVIGAVGMAAFAMPASMAASMVVAAVAIGLAMDDVLGRRRVTGKPVTHTDDVTGFVSARARRQFPDSASLTTAASIPGFVLAMNSVTGQRPSCF